MKLRRNLKSKAKITPEKKIPNEQAKNKNVKPAHSILYMNIKSTRQISVPNAWIDILSSGNLS